MTNQRTFLITGSSRGLGRGLSEHYVSGGHRVFGCSRGRSDLEDENYRHITADIGAEADVRALFREIKAVGGQIDVLVNNAGVSLSRYALMTTGDEAERILRTNLLGAFMVMREAVKHMKHKRHCRIINFSSISVPLGSSGRAIYSASKAALENMAFTLSSELAGEDITVNSVGPSIVAGSGMVDELGEEALNLARAKLLKPDSIDIAEVAHAIDFFAAPEARNITNQTVYFGGLK